MSVPGLKETWYDFLSTKQAYIKFIKTAVLYVINMIISILGMKFTASEHKEHSTHFHVPVSDQSWVLTGNERVSEPENHLLILTGDMLRVPPLVAMKGCRDNSYTFSFKMLLYGRFGHLRWCHWWLPSVCLCGCGCVQIWLQTPRSKQPQARPQRQGVFLCSDPHDCYVQKNSLCLREGKWGSKSSQGVKLRAREKYVPWDGDSKARVLLGRNNRKRTPQNHALEKLGQPTSCSPSSCFLQLPACDTGTTCFPGRTLDSVVHGVSAQTQEARHDICFIFLHLNSISVSSAQFPGILERKLNKQELCQGPAACLCQPLLRYLSSCLSGTFSWVIFLLPVSQLKAKESFCFLMPLGSHQRSLPARDTSAVVSHSEVLPGKQSPEPSETHQLHHFPSIILTPL